MLGSLGLDKVHNYMPLAHCFLWDQCDATGDQIWATVRGERAEHGWLIYLWMNCSTMLAC